MYTIECIHGIHAYIAKIAAMHGYTYSYIELDK